MSVNWSCGDFGLSLGVYLCVVSGHWLLAYFCPCGSEPKVCKGCCRESGPLPTFSLDSRHLPAACLSLSFSQWGCECEMSSELD